MNEMYVYPDVEFPCYSSHVKFPHIDKDVHTVQREMYDFNSLDQNTQDLLLQIIEQDTFTRYGLVLVVERVVV